ncbi:hypothetical protein [Geodermatophilus sp. SYSU D01176]
MDDDWDDSVSMRLAALALDRGRLTDDPVTALAVRGTLLIDPGLRGRVQDTEDAVEFDDRPSGFAPADRLLAQVAASLTELLRHGPVDQEDLAAEHLRRGSWTVRRGLLGIRYVDHRAGRTTADEQALEERQREAWTPDDAALAAVGSTLGLLATPRERAGEQLLARTGPVRRLADLVVDEVDRAITRGRFMRGAVSFADGSPG